MNVVKSSKTRIASEIAQSGEGKIEFSRPGWGKVRLFKATSKWANGIYGTRTVTNDVVDEGFPDDEQTSQASSVR